jgi:hypothetical protein
MFRHWYAVYVHSTNQGYPSELVLADERKSKGDTPMFDCSVTSESVT